MTEVSLWKLRSLPMLSICSRVRLTANFIAGISRPEPRSSSRPKNTKVGRLHGLSYLYYLAQKYITMFWAIALLRINNQ